MKFLKIILFFLIILILCQNLFPGVFTRGKMLYDNSEKNKKAETAPGIEQETSLLNAEQKNVLLNFEFWDKEGERHTGTYYPVSPENVRIGVKYGAGNNEFTGTYVRTTNILKTTNLTVNNYYITTNLSVTNYYITTNRFFSLRTGQITSYDDEDDGDLRKGFSGGYTNANGSWNGSARFTDNGDNTVTDNITGLMWTKNSVQNTQELSIVILTASQCTLGGYTDWRIPSRRELETLLDMGKYNPALPAGHPFLNVTGNYWTSTTCVNFGAWYINFTSGIINYNDKSMTYNAWYCRTK